MRWEDVKQAYPSQWVLIEAIDARTEGERRIIEEISVVDTFRDDNSKAMQRYVELHKQHKTREYYVVNTLRPSLDVTILKYLGLRQGW